MYNKIFVQLYVKNTKLTTTIGLAIEVAGRMAAEGRSEVPSNVPQKALLLLAHSCLSSFFLRARFFFNFLLVHDR